MEPSYTNTFYQNKSKMFNGPKLKLESDDIRSRTFLNQNQTIQQNPEEKLGYIFPNMTKESINDIVKRSGNNIGKAISLIKDMKNQEIKLNKLANPITKKINEQRRIKKGIKKRTYNQSIRSNPFIEKNNDKIVNKKEDPNQKNTSQNTLSSYISKPTNIINPSISNINNCYSNDKNIFISNEKQETSNESKNNININIHVEERISNQNEREENQNIQSNNNSSNSVVNNKQQNKNKIAESKINSNPKEVENEKNSLDKERTSLINKQIDYLLIEFSKMSNKEELESLLKMIGFPEQKEELIETSQKRLEQQTKINQEEIHNIVKKYEEIQKTEENIEEKKIKIEELSVTLGNLITVESDQKIREEKYSNKLKEILRKNQDNNRFCFGAREGY